MIFGRNAGFALATAIANLQPLAVCAAELRPLPVPSITLYPGDAISGDVMVEKLFTVTTANLQSYVVNIAQLEDKLARRTLVAGQPIALASIKERDTVRKGIPVPAVFEANGVTITTSLMPLESGTAGAFIQARNLESGLIVQARVQADGSLSVGAP